MRGRQASAVLLGLALAACAPVAARPAQPQAPVVPGAAAPQPAGTSASPAAAPAGTPAEGPSGGTVTATVGAVRLIRSTPPSPAAVAVRFVDALHGWAIAGCTAAMPCTLLATGDGGRTWTQQYQTSAQVSRLQFLNGQVGFATGPKAVLATTDGGSVWVVRDAAAPALRSVRFVSATTGWAAGRGGLLRTTDGGAQWTPIFGTAACSFSSLSFPNAAEGWAGGQGPGGPCLYGTSNGGATWTAAFTDAEGPPVRAALAAWAAATDQRPGAVAADMRGGCPVQVDFTSPASGWLSLLCYNHAYTGGRAVLRTTDAGRSWQYVWGLSDCLMGCYADSGGLPALFFLDGGTVWRLGAGGPQQPGRAPQAPFLTVERSTDAGRTWTAGTLNCGPLGYCGHVDFISAAQGWMATPAGIFATADGGLTWARRWPSAYGGPFRAVSFTGARHGFAVPLYAQNTIVATADGGATWTPLASFGATPLTGLDFTDALHGWAWTFAYSPTLALWSTDDGGRTWQRRTLPAGMANIAGVHLGFAAAGSGWLVDGNGDAWSTADGARQWTALPFTVATGCPYLTAAGAPPWRPEICPGGVRALTASGGWAAGDGGILHSRDGGETWTRRAWPGLQPLSIQFTAAADGWLLTRGGALWRTTDGGATWAEMSP